jgi:hypothetical protein
MAGAAIVVPPVMARGSVWEQESRFSRTGINLIIAEVGVEVQETMAAYIQVAAGRTWTGDRPALVVWGAWYVTAEAGSSSIIVSSSSIGKKEQGQRGVALETGLLAMNGLSKASIVTGGTKVLVGERVRVRVRVVVEVSGTPRAAEETRQ